MLADSRVVVAGDVDGAGPDESSDTAGVEGTADSDTAGGESVIDIGALGSPPQAMSAEIASGMAVGRIDRAPFEEAAPNEDGSSGT